MHLLCAGAVLVGAVVMLVSILKYYRALLRLREDSHSARTFSRRSYAVCMVLMLFFLAGYLVTGGQYFFRTEIGTPDLLVSAIFFFGSIFVWVVITVQGQMSDTISQQTGELVRTLVNAMEAKDQYTRGHSVHVSNIVALFYQHLPPQVQAGVDLGNLTDAAILHDIGKIGISDTILNKPGPLTDEEMAVIRTHPRMGKQILEQTSFSELGDIILAHHERMDQKGYYRLPAEDIPVEARIIAIADTFSALYSDRVYRPRKSFAEAMGIIREAAGTQLDPQLADIFVTITEEELLLASRNLFSMEQSPGAGAFPARMVRGTAKGAHRQLDPGEC